MTLLHTTHWSMIEKIDAVKTISLDDLKTFASHFKATFRLEGLVQGNYSKDQALEVARNMTTRLQPVVRLDKPLTPIRICQVPIGNKCCRLASFHPTDSNSVCVNYFQVGKSLQLLTHDFSYQIEFCLICLGPTNIHRTSGIYIKLYLLLIYL